jgi:GT2 family glycosyltransferase
MEALKNKITSRKIDYEHIKNEESHIVLFDKGDDYDVNVIIGARGRKEFLKPLYESFKKAIDKTDKKVCFTVVNHDHYPEHLKFCKKNKINFLWTKGNVLDQYSRCFAYNFGVKYSTKAKYYLLHDLDILVKENFFEEIFQNLKESKCMQSYGGRRVLYLSEKLTQKVINKEVDYNDFDENTPEVSLPMYNGKPALGSKGGSVFIERNLFYKVGGFDPELFWGYAAEDQFFWEKIRNVDDVTYADNPKIDMFHMWHPQSFSTNPLLYEMENDWKVFKGLNKEQKLEIIKLKKELYEK